MSGILNATGFPFTTRDIVVGLQAWEATTDYSDGVTVITPGGATVARSGTGTSGATYDATEAANYVLRDVGPVQTVYPGAGVYLYAGQTIAIEDRFYRWPADGPTANAAFTETDWVFASGDRAARFDSVAGLRGATLPTGVQTIDIAGYYGVGTPGGGTGMIVDRTDSVTLDDGAFFFRTANNVLVRRVDQTRISLAQAGAVPSVLTDQSAFMNAALTGLSSGGTLVIDPGRRYYIDAAGYEITRNNVTIDGEGTGELFNDQVGTATGLLRISGNNVTIKGVRFVNDFTTLGTLINLYAIELTGGDSVIMDGNYFKNWRYCCLGRAGSSWAVFSRNEVDTEPNGLTGCVLNGSNTVQKENRIIAFGDTGLGVASDTARNVTISNNLVVSRATHSSLGIIIEEGVEGALVSGNVVDGMWDGVTASNLGVSNGIRISDNATGRAPKGVVLVNNVVRNCEVYGIHVLNSAGGGATQLVENLVLQGNVVTACGSAPYQVSDVDKGVVNGNIASESNNFGIITQDNTDLVFIGNIAHGNTGTGMRPDNAVGPFIGNIATGNGQNLDFTRPSTTGEYFANYGYEGNQHRGELKKLRGYTQLTAGQTLSLTVERLPEDGKMIVYETIVWLNATGGVTDPDVNIISASNFNGALSGVVTLGNNNRFVNLSTPVIEDFNAFTTERYVRFALDNNSASTQDCYYSLIYRAVGGTV